MIDPRRLEDAYLRARADLLAQRTGDGHWIGELSASALSTATAISALVVAGRSDQDGSLIDRGITWLVKQQNSDGGWGDTDLSHSNLSTTLLTISALRIAGRTDQLVSELANARRYVDEAGAVAGLRARYGQDKTFAVPILMNCALAGLVPWREVDPLPFEWACLPQSFYRWMGLPVVSYAIPALVAIGQARHHHAPSANPLLRWLRSRAIGRSTRVLGGMQPDSGGFLEAIPLSCFVAMGLATTERVDHPVVREVVQFLRRSVRDDGSWPIDINLSTWVTTLALNALGYMGDSVADECVEWLLGCQHLQRHPFTGAQPGGWGWTDLSGAVPDADDTPGALLALARLRQRMEGEEPPPQRIAEAARMGVDWLLCMQNRDGGWPTFCRGWGKLPFDRSGADLTAHAIRAILAWRKLSPRRVDEACRRAFEYLERVQRSEGSWVPLWFGNQHLADETNPVYGTAKVLLAYRDAGTFGCESAQRAVDWLVQSQNPDGGWGGNWPEKPGDSARSSVEETGLAVETLAAHGRGKSLQTTLEKGLSWLIEAVETGQHVSASPIGFYFAKLWYHESLYPVVFTVAALGAALAGTGRPALAIAVEKNHRHIEGL